MEYISTKELAEKWGVDTSRILRLAKEGRISGAKLIGNRWIFPSDSQRLPDNRRKENRKNTTIQEFHFPLYYYTLHSEDELRSFTKDERTLYDAEIDYLRNDYGSCCSTLSQLKENTADHVVKIGAIYILCMSYLYQKNYYQATLCFREMKSIFMTEFPHKKVLILMLHDLESYFSGAEFYIDNISISLDSDYFPRMRDYFMLEIAFSDMMKVLLQSVTVNPMPYELFCVAEEKRIAPFSAVLMHLYVSLIYIGTGDADAAVMHLRKSSKIAEENNIEREIAFAVHYFQDMFQSALKDENPEQLSRLLRLSEDASDFLNGLHKYLKKDNILRFLNPDDTKLILFAKQGMTNKEVGALLGLSVNTISKKYAVILEKTGIHSKKELVRVYQDAMKNF